MMKRVLFILTFPLPLLFSCESVQDNGLKPERLTADFTINNPGDSVFESELLDLSNNSTGASAYSWDFGNGTRCTDKVPTTSYSTEGNYTITLTATNSGGQTATASHAVTVVHH